jgi:hydrogenase maturation protease
MSGRILVAGVGNIFLGDDAFGVEVVRQLARKTLPQSVRVVDFGIRSYDLAYALMEDWDLVILVDAMARGDAPGTVYIMEPELPASGDPATVDAHTMNPFSVLQLVKALGGKCGRMLVVGCEPANLEPDTEGNIGVSELVGAAVDQAVGVVEELISRACSQATAA